MSRDIHFMAAIERTPETSQGSFDRWIEQWAATMARVPGVGPVAVNRPIRADGSDLAPAPWSALVTVPAEARSRIAIAGSSPSDTLCGAPSVAASAVWRVRSDVRKGPATDIGSPDGTRTHGLKMIAWMRPAPGKSAADCATYWSEQHTGLALRIHVGLAGYRQNAVVECVTGGAASQGSERGRDVFGISELHFATERDFRERFFDSDSGREAIYTDVPHFMSLTASESGIYEEMVFEVTA